jgi:hypothetical protein
MSTTFFAILADGDNKYALRVPVTKPVQDALIEEFERQSLEFVRYSHRVENADGVLQKQEDDSERIEFFPLFTVDDKSQVFELEDFEIDDFILDAARKPDSVGDLRLTTDTIPKIKAFCAAEKKGPKTTIYFQAFDRRRSLSTNNWTFLQSRNSFSKLDHSGFTLADSLSAIYQNGSLLFRSYAVVSRFLSLVSVFNEASDSKVDEVLKNKTLWVKDAASVIAGLDSLMRKQFTAISGSGVLEKASPQKIAKAAKEFDFTVSLVTSKGKQQVEFPDAKRDQKDLLKLLTEGYYLGPVTGEKFQSNSHRPLKKRKN